MKNLILILIISIAISITFIPVSAELNTLQKDLVTKKISSEFKNSKFRITNAKFVVLREKPDINSGLVNILVENDEFKITETINGWVKISYIRGEGWMRTHYVIKMDSVDTATGTTTDTATSNNTVSTEKPAENSRVFGFVKVNSYLNVRTGPSTDYEKIGKLYNTDKVEILEEKNGWYRIKWVSGEAWVSGRYVTKDSGNDSSSGTETDSSTDSSSVSDNNDTYKPPVKGKSLLEVPKRSQFEQECIVNGTDYRRSWCGPVAFGMVLDYYGIHKSSYECAKLCKYTFKTRNGTPSSGILSGAKEAGFSNSKLVTGKSMSWLKDQINDGKPVIVNVDQRWKGHYIVVVGVTDSGDVIVNDPGKGAVSRVQYTIPKNTFWGYWASKSRRAIVIEK